MEYKHPGRLRASLLNPVLMIGRLTATILLLGLAMSASAQTAQGTGTVEGRVLNIGNNRYLNNAKVSVDGTAISTSTNEFGEYRLSNVPAGEVKIRSVYTGLDDNVSTVTVTPVDDITTRTSRSVVAPIGSSPRIVSSGPASSSSGIAVAGCNDRSAGNLLSPTGCAT